MKMLAVMKGEELSVTSLLLGHRLRARLNDPTVWRREVMKVLVKNFMLNEIYGIYIYLTITNSGITNLPFLILYFKS